MPAAKLSVDIKNDFAPKYAIVKGKAKLVKAEMVLHHQAFRLLLVTPSRFAHVCPEAGADASRTKIPPRNPPGDSAPSTGSRPPPDRRNTYAATISA